MALMESKPPNACLDPNANLRIDEACLSIANAYNRSITFYSIPSECHVCHGIPQAVVPPNHNTTVVIPTRYPLHIYYTSDYEYCHTTYTFKEHGNYGWNVSREDLCSDIYTLYNPPDPYLPILAAFLVYTFLAVTWTTSNVIYRCVKERLLRSENIHDDLGRLQGTDSPVQPVIRTTRTSTRIRSIDTFRGIAILLMIFVNNGGGKYVFFNHTAWNGLTVADLVFPWFAWIMGITITISKRAELRVSNSRGRIILRSLRRSLVLIALGLILNSQYTGSLKELRFPGVLQLLAVSYFVCATLETIFMKPHTEDYALQFGRFTVFRDIIDNWAQWLIILTIVAVHTLIIFFLPVPNCPRGYLGPGGYAQYGKYANCTGGAAGYIDRLIFGSHMYRKKVNPVYGPVLPHDPEGIMNTMSAILVVYMGVHAGKILLLYYQYSSRVIRWLFWAICTGIVAGVLCNYEKEEGLIPVNKKMWSLSFVLTVSSFAFLLYAFLYLLVDYKQYWSGAPFVYAGINPMILYIGHVITMHIFPWSWEIENPTHASLLAMNLWSTSLWAIIAYFLYKKDIIITV